jgi:hypothetical protein
LITDPDLDPALFFSDFLDANKKLVSSPKFFCLLLTEGTFTSVYKEFLIFQHMFKMKGRISIRIGINRMPILYTVIKDWMCAGEPGAGSAQ